MLRRSCGFGGSRRAPSAGAALLSTRPRRPSNRGAWVTPAPAPSSTARYHPVWCGGLHNETRRQRSGERELGARELGKEFLLRELPGIPTIQPPCADARSLPRHSTGPWRTTSPSFLAVVSTRVPARSRAPTKPSSVPVPGRRTLPRGSCAFQSRGLRHSSGALGESVRRGRPCWRPLRTVCRITSAGNCVAPVATSMRERGSTQRRSSASRPVSTVPR